MLRTFGAARMMPIGFTLDGLGRPESPRHAGVARRAVAKLRKTITLRAGTFSPRASIVRVW